MNTVVTNQILSTEDVNRKIRRMAFEIAERNSECRSLIIAGVAGNGVVVAKNVIKELQQIIPCTIDFITISLDKHNPVQPTLSEQIPLDGKTIIVSSSKVKNPEAVRFAWKSVPNPNLFNAENLPASPFRAEKK